jgi:urease accessory protein UreF
MLRTRRPSLPSGAFAHSHGHELRIDEASVFWSPSARIGPARNI